MVFSYFYIHIFITYYYQSYSQCQCLVIIVLTDIVHHISNNKIEPLTTLKSSKNYLQEREHRQPVIVHREHIV